MLTAKLVHLSARSRARLDQILLLFKPETVLRWHHELGRRQWTIRHRKLGGRPAVLAEVEALVLQLACENPG